MKITKLLSALFGLLFCLFLAAALILSVAMRNAPTLALGTMEAAEAQTQTLMEAICSKDFSKAEQLLSGSNNLNSRESFHSPLTTTLWDAYYSSITYQFHGGCYTDDYGLYRDVTVTYLDIPTLLEDLQSRTLALSDNLAEQAQSMAQSGTYTAKRTLTLQLISTGGRWSVLSSPELLDFISGSMGGG